MGAREPAIKPRWGRAPLMGSVIGTLLGLFGCQAGGRPPEPPAAPVVIERLGELEILEHGTPGAAGDSGRSTEMKHWSLRWRGEPLQIASRGGLWGDQPTSTAHVNAAFIVGEGEAAELIVNLGDPNNTGAFHVLRREGGALQAPLLCVTLAGDNAVRPLHEAAVQPALAGPRLERLPGVRRLMLGSHCVYDLPERRLLRVARSGDFSLWARELMLLSPDGRSLVRIGSPDSAQRNAAGEPVTPPPHLIVLDLDPVTDPTDVRAGGHWRALALDRRTMRYADDSEIDKAWVEHHFRWQRDGAGRDRLVARGGVVPLPWRGRVHPTYSQYELQAAEHDPAPVLAEFLERRFAAKRLPPSSAEDSSRRYSLRGETVVLYGSGLHVEQAASYWPGQVGDPALQHALVAEIGAAFDAELAAGRHRQLFEPAR